MVRRVGRSIVGVLGGIVLLAVAGCACCTQVQEKTDLSLIPPKVMDGLKARFPKAQIDKWTREKEGDVVVYDIEFKQDGRKFEADIKEDGTIHNWEKAIEAKDLPAVVRKAAETRYPMGMLKEVMEVTAVKDGKDVAEGFEIVLETAQKKVVEIMVSPEGKILEDSGTEKK